MAIYAFPKSVNIDNQALLALGQQLGLVAIYDHLRADDDGVSRVQQLPQHSDRYIPYSARALNWHTDGYYQPPNRAVSAFILHCCQDAQSGGDSYFVDHEIIYALLHEADPEYIHALSDADAMAIPANEHDGKIIRPECRGPVFEFSQGYLRMRYTARKRYVCWGPGPSLSAAREYLQQLLSSTPFIVGHRLQPGQGVVCHNILHRRSAYQDAVDGGRSRLLLRVRYADRLRYADPHCSAPQQ